MLLSVLFVAFIHKSHSDGQSRSDGQKMKKIHVNKALGPPLGERGGAAEAQGGPAAGGGWQRAGQENKDGGHRHTEQQEEEPSDGPSKEIGWEES